MRSLLFTLSCFISLSCFAQSSIYDSVNQKRNRLVKTGMVVLGSWSLGSVSSGIVGYNNSEGTRREFHRMNALIGGVNLGLATITYLLSKKAQGKTYFAAETFKEQEKAEKLFLFNTGLDAGYIALGFYLKERGNRFTSDKRNRLKGAGNSVLLQGGFLTLFDGVLYLLHNKNGNRLNPLLQKLSFQTSQDGFGLAYRF